MQIFVGNEQPRCTNHSFVLQEHNATVYGVCLRVWSRADPGRAQVLRELAQRENGSTFEEDTSFWIPYSLCFLSSYPLYSLLGSYIRAMWIHWSKTTNLFHAEEVARILSFPAPRLRDVLRIDMKDYALCYQFPSKAEEFQNFDAWPLFSCLSPIQMAAVLETAFAVKGRLIFISDHLAMLNLASETVRLCCRALPWGGLFVPVAHYESIPALIQQPGPYIIGVPARCRNLIQADPDVMLADLDRGQVHVKRAIHAFERESSRKKFIDRLSCALGGNTVGGVPKHLQESYLRNQLTPEGQVMVFRGRIETVEMPAWWSQEEVLHLCAHSGRKAYSNNGMKKIFSGEAKKPDTTLVLTTELVQLQQDSRRQAQEVQEAWQAFCELKARYAIEVRKLHKRNDFLTSELDTCREQFEKFEKLAADLSTQSLELKRHLTELKTENVRLSVEIKDKNSAVKDLSEQLKHVKDHREQASKMQRLLAEEYNKEKLHLKERIRLIETENRLLQVQREQVESVLLELRHIIQAQPDELDKIFEVDEATNEPGLGGIVNPVEPQPSVPIEPHASVAIEGTKSTGLAVATLVEPDTPNDASSTASFADNDLPGLIPNDIVGRRSSVRSLSDVKDKVVRRKAEQIAALVDRITSRCLETLDQINETAPTIGHAETASVSSQAGRPTSMVASSSRTSQNDMVTAGDGSHLNKRHSRISDAVLEEIQNIDRQEMLHKSKEKDKLKHRPSPVVVRKEAV